MSTLVDTPCPQAWHGGLAVELPVQFLVECKYPAGHRGWHRSAKPGLEWSGKLTREERARAEALRRQCCPHAMEWHNERLECQYYRLAFPLPEPEESRCACRVEVVDT